MESLTVDIRDLPLFAPADRAKLSAHCAAIVAQSGEAWHLKAWWAAVAGCGEHALSARFSDLRKRGYAVERRIVNDDGSGEKVKRHEYRVRVGS